MGGIFSTHGKAEKYLQCFGLKTSGKSPFGRLRRRREDNIRIDLRVVGWEGVDWIHLAQDRDQ
jgi:hypothetical protein